MYPSHECFSSARPRYYSQTGECESEDWRRSSPELLRLTTRHDHYHMMDFSKHNKK